SYDPMIAKLISFGKNRQEAIERMIRAIDEYIISGIQTTLPFGKFVMQHDAFTSGNFDTHFVKNYFNTESLKQESVEEAEIAAIIAVKLISSSKKAILTEHLSANNTSNWKKNRTR